MNTRKLEIWILLADFAWIAAAFLGADLLRFGLTWTQAGRNSVHALLPFLFATFAVWIVLSVLVPMDGFRGGWKLSAVLSQLVLGTGSTVSVLSAVGYLSRNYVSRLALGYFIILLLVGFLAVRLRVSYFAGDMKETTSIAW